VLVVVAILLALSGAVYGYLIRPALLAVTQIDNLGLMRQYSRAIIDYRARSGQYPKALGDVMQKQPVVGRAIPIGEDMWGHPISYSELEDGFLLVSFGQDGRPDGTTYRELRLKGGQDEGPCRDPNADQIFSDRGEHRTCGK
jgi:hypothetical protein